MPPGRSTSPSQRCRTRLTQAAVVALVLGAGAVVAAAAGAQVAAIVLVAVGASGALWLAQSAVTGLGLATVESAASLLATSHATSGSSSAPGIEQPPRLDP